jgi:hypothetical protein
MGAMKNVLIDVMSGMDLAARNLEEAADRQDPELMEAVMVNVLASLPSYLEALRKVKP